MSRFAYEDKLEILGIIAGSFIILVALGTLLEPPWTTNEATGAAIVQTIGIFLTIVVGLVLIQFTYSGDLRDLIPGRGSEDAE